MGSPSCHSLQQGSLRTVQRHYQTSLVSGLISCPCLLTDCLMLYTVVYPCGLGVSMDATRCCNCERKLGAPSPLPNGPTPSFTSASGGGAHHNRPSAHPNDTGQREGPPESRGIDGSYVMLRQGDMMLGPGVSQPLNQDAMPWTMVAEVSPRRVLRV